MNLRPLNFSLFLFLFFVQTNLQIISSICIPLSQSSAMKWYLIYLVYIYYLRLTLSLFEDDWSTYGFNNQRNSINKYSTSINLASAPSLVNVWNLNLMNYVVAQSVVALNVAIISGRRSLLENLSSSSSSSSSSTSKDNMNQSKSNSGRPKAQAFASSSLPTSNLCETGTNVFTRNFAYVGDESGHFYGIDIDEGCVVWSIFVGVVNYTQCVDLPSWGVSGTAVFNRTIDTVYVVGGNATLYALSMQTGHVYWSLSNLYDPTLLTNYGALTLHNQVLYITSASRCDFGDYHGGVYAVSTLSHTVINSFLPSQNLKGGGIWGLGGITVGLGSTPSLYFATGNALGSVENAFYCEKVVQTTLELQVVADTSFPFNTQNVDEDFGSTVTLFNTPQDGQSSGCSATLLSATRKDGLFVVVNADTMQSVQTIQLSDPAHEELIHQAAWDPDSNMLIVPTDHSYNNISKGLVGYRLDSSCQLNQVWNTMFDFPSSPTIVGPSGERVVVATGSSILYILDIRTGSVIMHKYGPGGMASVSAPVVVGDLILVSNVALSIVSAFKVTSTPSLNPTYLPTAPTNIPFTISPTKSMFPSLAPITAAPTNPTKAPVTIPTSTPTGPKPGKCLVYNGINTGCSDCQYCPDGSLCNLCHSPSIPPTLKPDRQLPTALPSLQPSIPTLIPTRSPTQPTLIPIPNPTITPSISPSSSHPTITRPGMCPPYNSIHTGCSDCQFCPDGSLCNLCPPSMKPTLVPSIKPTVAPSTPHQPSIIPIQTPCHPTAGPSLGPSSPSMSPSISPDNIPTPKPILSQIPTDIGSRPGTCPLYNGLEIGCSDCQFCPDGSLCNLCPPSMKPTLAPSIIPTLAPSMPHQPSILPSLKPTSPTVVPSAGPSFPSFSPSKSPDKVPSLQPLHSTVPTVIRSKPGVCPIYNGLEIGCSDCQYCPDGSLCNLCREPSIVPSHAPVSSTPVSVVPSLAPTRQSNSTNNSVSSGISSWVSQNQTIFGVVIALGVAILCVIFILFLRADGTDVNERPKKIKASRSPMVLDLAIIAPSPTASPMASQSVERDSDFGVLLRRFSNAIINHRKSSAAPEKTIARRTSSIAILKVPNEPTRLLATIQEGNETEKSPAKISVTAPETTSIPVKRSGDSADLVGARQQILDAMKRNKAKQAQFASDSADETQL